jgi:plasmid stability protein
MKTSLDLPDELHRQLKAKSALAGKSVREVATSLFTAWVDDRVPASALETATAGEVPPAGAGVVTRDARDTWLAEWRSMSHDVAAAMRDQPGLVDTLLSDRR